MYGYGLIGNCQVSALISENGGMDWLCMPRPDSPPIFGRLLDPDGGHFTIASVAPNARVRQTYTPNTAILETFVTDEDGSEFRITDFCPRFLQHGRTYRPASLFRIVEPLRGSPAIRVSCRPVAGWTKAPVTPQRGNSHLKFDYGADHLRLVTNMPLTYLCDETSFSLKETLYFGLTWSYGLEDDLPLTAQRFRDQTIDYWKTWVKHCSIPSLYQEETIRSSITLKLHCFEDTGAILAALTTSLPEEVGHTRNWDYRFCWLRDAHFTLSAFHNLGHFEETEGFLNYLLDIAEKHEHSRDRLHPVYALDRSLPLPETEHSNWAGYGNSQPVRSFNQAAEHIQNDVYGEMVLTLAPIFFDERFRHLRTPHHERLLESLGKYCHQTISMPDAGLWEIRDGWREHSFSNLMCWAGIERISRIRERGFLKNLDFDPRASMQNAEQAIRRAVNDHAITNSPADFTLDASLLLAPILRFPDASLNRNTVLRIQRELALVVDGKLSEAFLYRYLRTDDFGRPQSAFLICSFWLVQALAKIGEHDAARTAMKQAMSSANHLGLFSEHYLPAEKTQSGNFPQAYSHVGQINAAFAVSPAWSEVL